MRLLYVSKTIVYFCGCGSIVWKIRFAWQQVVDEIVAEMTVYQCFWVSLKQRWVCWVATPLTRSLSPSLSSCVCVCGCVCGCVCVCVHGCVRQVRSRSGAAAVAALHHQPGHHQLLQLRPAGDARLRAQAHRGESGRRRRPQCATFREKQIFLHKSRHA